MMYTFFSDNHIPVTLHITSEGDGNDQLNIFEFHCETFDGPLIIKFRGEWEKYGILDSISQAIEYFNNNYNL